MFILEFELECGKGVLQVLLAALVLNIIIIKTISIDFYLDAYESYAPGSGLMYWMLDRFGARVDVLLSNGCYINK